MLNLMELDSLQTTPITGKPLELSISDVIEDPSQPREHFDEDELKALAASIQERGVKTPISVKPKNQEGKYLINHGARRFKASVLAGKTMIPAFIDAIHDDYDQVTENIQRANLTPMEIASFIQKRLEQGDKKGDIAKILGQSSYYISIHLALIKAPFCIQQLAKNTKIGARTLYALINAYEMCPHEIEHSMVNEKEITRNKIEEWIAFAKSRQENALFKNSKNSINTAQLKTVEQSKNLIIQECLVDKTAKKENTHKQNNDNNLSVKRNTTVIPSIQLKTKEGRTATLIMKGIVSIQYEDTGEIAPYDLEKIVS